ncbi:hypothetical protein H4R34_002453 [Dimargaris verticillata]|uniref:GATA-type domain-containing protein n=1 Tax=Dimargaris verticillata TaxID=2761393 RepID=A0A9W8B3U8_9FUNG|nr:hypothetical protein H4R34_002453 [Dimargaris verticillata]
MVLTCSAILFTSLSKSRHAWTHSVFTPYHASAETQLSSPPKESEAKTSLPRLSDCTLVIGPHIFPQTTFYHAPGASSARAPAPLVFSFRDNPEARWLFPSHAIVEPTTMDAPYEVLVSFRLPNDLRTDQPLIMNMMLVDDALRRALQAYTANSSNDPTATIMAVNAQLAHPPTANIPLDYFLPCELPATLLDDPEVQTYISTLLDGPSHAGDAPVPTPPSVSTTDASNFPGPKTPFTRTTKKSADALGDGKKSSKKAKNYNEGPDTPSPRKSQSKSGNGNNGGGTNKRSPSGSYNNNPGGTKKCQYCGCKTTPMWRRGPAGPGTLCNACGVKWKHGKILQGVTSEDMSQRVAEQARAEAGKCNSASSPTDTNPSSLAAAMTPTPASGSKGRIAGRPATPKSTSRKASTSEGAAAMPLSTAPDKAPGTSGKRRNPQKRSSASESDDPAVVVLHSGSVAAAASKGSPSDPTAAERGSKLTVKATKKRRVSSVGGTLDGNSRGSPTEPSKTKTTPNQGKAQDQPVSTSPSSGPAHHPSSLPLTQVQFGPSNATFAAPNCQLTLRPDRMDLWLVQGKGSDTTVSLYKETIDDVTFSRVTQRADGGFSEVGQHEPVRKSGPVFLRLQAMTSSYLTRFGKELLNPDRNQSTIVLYLAPNQSFATLEALETHLRSSVES